MNCDNCKELGLPTDDCPYKLLCIVGDESGIQIKKAIMAERERCAKVCEQYLIDRSRSITESCVLRALAESIRKGA